jgi:hypothetical protein
MPICSRRLKKGPFSGTKQQGAWVKLADPICVRGPALRRASNHVRQCSHNADDWVRNAKSTSRISGERTVSSASAMVFMNTLSAARPSSMSTGWYVGLYLNLTMRFSMFGCSPRRFRRGQMAGVTR